MEYQKEELDCFQAAVGKKVLAIESSWCSGQAIISFEDSFITLAAKRDYDGDITIEQEPLDVGNFGQDVLANLGIIDGAAIERERQRKRELQEKANREARRRQYESLKREFDPPPPPACKGCGTKKQGNVKHCINCGELDQYDNPKNPKR